MLKQLRFIILVLFFCPVLARAQDNNLLAKLAYENAESALSERNFSAGISELKKVDELLGKLTPKSQFLRVQLWIGAAEMDPVYLDSAIVQSKKYLALSKSFEIPEDKQMEALRQLQKMEKDKVVYDKKAKEEKAANNLLQKIEMGAAKRDQAVIAVLSGLDINNDVLEELTNTGRLPKKDVNYYKKHQTPLTNTYLYKGRYYSIPVNIYSKILSKRESFRVNGLETDMLVDTYFTTTDGAFQELKIILLKPVPDIDIYVNKVSAILGFNPDAQVRIDANSGINYTNWPFWSFKDYTISLIKHSVEMAKASGYVYSLSIVRHYPNTSTPLQIVPLAPWEEKQKRQENKNRENIEANTIKIQANQNDHFAYYSRGIAKMNLKDYTGALEDINQAISINPNAASYYKHRAYAKHFLKDYAAALDDYSRTVQLDPDDIESYQYCALLKDQTGDYKGAVEAYTKLIDLGAKDTSANKLDNYYARGIDKYRLKDFDGSYADLTKYIQLGGRLTASYYWRGKILFLHRGNKTEAAQDFQKIVEGADTNVQQALSYFFLGDKEKALKIFNDLVKGKPNDHGLYYSRAGLYSLDHNKAAALADLQLAMEKGFKDFNRITNDENMDFIRDEPEFKTLIQQYKK